MTIKKTIMIAAGGTGGHIFPGLAVANKLKKNYHIHWIGSNYGMEKRLVPKYGYPLKTVSSVGLRGKSLLHLLKSPFLLTKALIQTVIIFRKIRPHIVLTMGGFTAGITGVVAKLFGVPLVIHEQNAIAGSTNKILAKFATRVYQAFPNSFSHKVTAITCGNPIFFQPKAKINHKTNQTCLNLLVVGGSLGAQIFNKTIPLLKTGVKIIHQSGKEHFDTTKLAYQNSQNSVEVVDFLDDMAASYAWADVVISRAGAMTISEIMLSGSCAILVPYPYAIDDHQTANARILSANKAGILLPQSEFSVARLDEILLNLSSQKINTIANNAKKLSDENSANEVVRYLEGLLDIKISQ